MEKLCEKTAEDFSRFVLTDITEKVQPINKLIDDMFARLEEFQTMIYFAKQERISALNSLASVHGNFQMLTNLLQRIDSIENLIEQVKITLSVLERDIEKAEEELGYTESTTNKVANIFTPLFKKNTNSDRSHSPNLSQIYKTSDYFYSNSDLDKSEE
ncbi:hypothetical protein Zmor_006491 [Zophobas morio]|uniref:Biogenesis of lysosome-related organelles complex 1 subunit 4 n=1 Tax=Zophobas morio TaxID=2755281 RepID=A0AA38ISE2_9CUCU|nr:hypothetical protein Zmor_006491 [Zophobas morio]